MADKVSFELVSPERLLLSEEVDMVVVPGAEGLFGVLPGHSPLISTLDPGVIETYEGDAIAKRMFVAGGFAEVTETRCTVLAEQAMPVDELDQAAIEQAIKDHAEDVEDAKDDDSRAQSEAKLSIAKAQLQAITGQIVV